MKKQYREKNTICILEQWQRSEPNPKQLPLLQEQMDHVECSLLCACKTKKLLKLATDKKVINAKISENLVLPFSKAGTLLVVGCTPWCKPIQSLAPWLVIWASKWNMTLKRTAQYGGEFTIPTNKLRHWGGVVLNYLVHLHPRHNVLCNKNIDHLLAIYSRLIESFLKQDCPWDVLPQARCWDVR